MQKDWIRETGKAALVLFLALGGQLVYAAARDRWLFLPQGLTWLLWLLTAWWFLLGGALGTVGRRLSLRSFSWRRPVFLPFVLLGLLTAAGLARPGLYSALWGRSPDSLLKVAALLAGFLGMGLFEKKKG